MISSCQIGLEMRETREEVEGRDYKGALNNFRSDGYVYYLKCGYGCLGGDLSNCTV